MKDEVEAVLESIRPMLINDGGNVELEGCDFQAHCTWDTRVVALNFGIRSTFYY